ncbi:glycine zipper 2TM domain-containing protein [Burkholderia pyrrocinia]|uniref:glycine zipper 2TM domain-containing protein n=1 Tax=Burkholderia TaxID=32008 RepID=UPI000503B2BB|nr:MULTISPECIES: glycine zipper 2TM domain-containing protein [Burkholderia]EKS9886219.1 glycine zipper 2TM domain-containing protein [Burkholderia pyrrocinia]EKS9895301.1 glycine zipper 2TM domain-containing protein [Burkholderia pyrrocinia]EKS9907850.1 glycine zipper 2TM domain-containing protein [Burkholderia pyrrocinia]KFL50946.1 membrane protein [Burkholderia pyrrocinia]
MDNQNQTTPQKQRLHPLIATAAGAVIVASLAATAAITGVFPKASSSNEQNGQTQAALIASQPAVDTAAAASAALAAQARQQAAEQAAAQQKAIAQAEPKPAPRPATTHRRHTQAPQPPQYAQQPSAPAQAAYCQSCGTVVAITQTRTPGQSSGIGAVGGAAAGGLLGNQFGNGNGRTAMTIIGALGGGLAGNQVEKQVRAETDYQVQVQMESGATRTFTYHNPPPFGQGQRVRIENGTLVGA